MATSSIDPTKVADGDRLLAEAEKWYELTQLSVPSCSCLLVCVASSFLPFSCASSAVLGNSSCWCEYGIDVVLQHEDLSVQVEPRP